MYILVCLTENIYDLYITTTEKNKRKKNKQTKTGMEKNWRSILNSILPVSKMTLCDTGYSVMFE